MTRMTDDPAAEMLMPVTTADAMKQAELHVMRGIANSLDTLTRRFDRMDTKHDEMSTILTRMDAQDVRGALREHVIEFNKYKEGRETLTTIYDTRVKTLELTVARYSGVLLPLSILGTAMLSAFGTFVMVHFVGK